MPLARSLYLLPLALAWGTLSAQEATPKPEEKPAVQDSVKADDKAHDKCGFRRDWHSRSHRHSTFSASVPAA